MPRTDTSFELSDTGSNDEDSTIGLLKNQYKFGCEEQKLYTEVPVIMFLMKLGVSDQALR
jgi:hypothetical protein